MTKELTFVLLVIALFSFLNLAVADMYKWVDQNGVIHFSDTLPSTNNQVETMERTNYPASNPESAPIKPKILPQPTKKDDTQEKVYNKRKRQRIISKGVEIYTTSWCKYCKKAIAFLKSNRVKFRQYDIEKDLNAAKRMKALGGTGGVPFALINGKRVYGFTLNRYSQALGLR